MVRRGVLIVKELVPALLEDRGKGFGEAFVELSSHTVWTGLLV